MKISAVILAAGKGSRMKSDEIPKVMFIANGKPLLAHLIDSVKLAGIDDITLVVGFKKEKVIDYFGDKYHYAIQTEQLGTGHAVKMAKDILAGKTDAVLVSYGDMPLFKPETIKKLIEKFKSEKPTMAMLTVVTDDPIINDFSRVVRDENGDVIRTVEFKDSTEEILKIREKNPSLYLFDSNWLWENLEKISTENSQKEYYLPDLIEIASKSGKRVVAQPSSDAIEAIGVNTPEQLKFVEEVLTKRK